jgi:hypothetical protein
MARREATRQPGFKPSADDLVEVDDALPQSEEDDVEGVPPFNSRAGSISCGSRLSGGYLGVAEIARPIPAALDSTSRNRLLFTPRVNEGIPGE